MAITVNRKARIEARIEKKETYLDVLYNLSDNFDDVASYVFDSGEGKQATNFRSLSEVTQAIKQTESQIDRLYRVLNGTSIVNVHLRRY